MNNNTLKIIEDSISFKESIFTNIFNESKSDSNDEVISKKEIKDIIIRRKFHQIPEDKYDYRYEEYMNLDNDVDLIYDVLNNIKFPARLFRGLRIPKGKKLRLDNTIGEHWTTNWNIFEREGVYDFNKPDVIVSGLISKDMVNWEQTVINRYSDIYCGPDGKEYEIELKSNTAPDDIMIETDLREIYD